nr:immunoglobulin light chain junction region [Macaca mulatta]
DYHCFSTDSSGHHRGLF